MAKKYSKENYFLIVAYYYLLLSLELSCRLEITTLITSMNITGNTRVSGSK